MVAKTDKEVEEQAKALHQKRSGAVKERNKFLKEGGVPAPGLGKGKEPIELWCACHNRHPCPIEEELKRG